VSPGFAKKKCETCKHKFRISWFYRGHSYCQICYMKASREWIKKKLNEMKWKRRRE